MWIIVIWLILSITLVVGVIVWINAIMNNWLFDLIVHWLLILEDLFWSTAAYLFLSLFVLAWMTLMIRFIMSRIGENPWQSANKG